MSKINEINQKLSELNGGEFQKLMDTYFYKIFKGSIYPIGSVLENNNTKTGTPDTLIKIPSEKYVYIEYTVQKNNILSKFKEDIAKCLDEKKTGINKSLIEKIICCCNSRLETSEIEKLISIGRDHKIVVEVISLDSIAYRLKEFPVIVKDFFGISIDTQQILDIEDFINKNDSAKLATPLNVNIFGREKEIEDILKAMEQEQIVLISGLPGVGKTRLTLECIRKFHEQHSEYQIKCIKNNGQNIYDDLNLYFGEPGFYVIMVDDANLLTNIQLTLDLFSLETKGIKIKLILTVREYAEEKIIDKISNYTFETFKIKTLTDESIKLVCEYSGVLNTRYIDRIIDIAKGNPRLAMMACAIAKKENSLSSLSNVIDIVEGYYKEIRFYFEKDIQNVELLKVGALLSFLTYVNLKDNESLDLMCDVVDQDKQTLLKNIIKLHSMEVVDIYENELVKVSDQILSVYIFYLSVFRKKYLLYKNLIEKFYPFSKDKIVENLNNVFSYFYKEENFNIVKNAITEFYEDRKNSLKEVELEEFLITFYFAFEIEGLIYAKNKIDSFEFTSTTNIIDYEIKNNIEYTNILKLLSRYKKSEHYLEAIDLILLYLEKKPTEFSSVYKILTDNYGFEEESDTFGYIQELELLKKINQNYELNKDTLYENLLIKTLEYYLRFNYEHTRMKDNKHVIFSRIPVHLKQSLPEIREKIWTKITELFNQKYLLNDIYKILYNYGRNNINSIDEEVLKFDKKFIESIINNVQQPNLEQSIVFNRLKNLYARYEIYFIEEIDKMINTEEYLIYEKIFGEPKYNDKDRISEEKELMNWAETLSVEDFHKIFTICNQITSIDYLNPNLYSSTKAIETLLLNVSIKEKLAILDIFFKKDIKINLNPINIIKNVKDLNQLEKYILNAEFFNKDYWLYCVYREMSFLNPNNDLLQKIYTYFDRPEGEVSGYSKDITFLKSFICIDENVFINVINSLLKQKDIVVLRSVELFLSDCVKNDEYIVLYLKNDLNLLKTLYLRLLNIKQNFDYDSSILKTMTRKKSTILKEMLENILMVEKNTYAFNTEIDFTFIWEEDNWFELAELVSEIIEKDIHVKEKYFLTKDLLKKFLLVDDYKSEKFKNTLYVWIESKIMLWVEDKELIINLYECLTGFENNQQIEWIIKLIEINSDFKFFKQIPLLPSSYSWSGSEVPILREQQLFYQQLSKKLQGILYLEHKQWLKEKIDWLEEKIKKVKVRELTEDLY